MENVTSNKITKKGLNIKSDKINIEKNNFHGDNILLYHV